jgi:hypothetical protein
MLNVLLFRVLTGTMVVARTPARTVTSMVTVASVASVVESTEPETSQRAILLSKLTKEKERVMVAEWVDKAAQGPKSIDPPHPNKHKQTDNISNFVLKFKHGFAWSDSSHNISPSALYTETAKPLPRPPEHLLNDPVIQAALAACKNHIEVKTPFNVDKLGAMSHDHPNPPLVQSVLIGLRKGFWPFDEGEWKIELEEVIGNYSTEEPDLEAI